MSTARSPRDPSAPARSAGRASAGQDAHDDNRLLTTRQAAAYAPYTPHGLEKLRCAGRGPRSSRSQVVDPPIGWRPSGLAGAAPGPHVRSGVAWVPGPRRGRAPICGGHPGLPRRASTPRGRAYCHVAFGFSWPRRSATCRTPSPAPGETWPATASRCGWTPRASRDGHRRRGSRPSDWTGRATRPTVASRRGHVSRDWERPDVLDQPNASDPHSFEPPARPTSRRGHLLSERYGSPRGTWSRRADRSTCRQCGDHPDRAEPLP